MTPDALRDALASLAMNQSDLAWFLDVNTRTVRRWVCGSAPIPRSVSLLLAVMVDQGLTAEEVEELAR